MSAPSFSEDHISQTPAPKLLVYMGYQYITPSQSMEWHKGKNSVVLFEDVLFNQLQKINIYKNDAKFFLKLLVDVKYRYNDDISYKERANDNP